MNIVNRHKSLKEVYADALIEQRKLLLCIDKTPEGSVEHAENKFKMHRLDRILNLIEQLFEG